MLVPVLLASAVAALSAAWQLSPARRTLRRATRRWTGFLAPWRRIEKLRANLEERLRRAAEPYRAAAHRRADATTGIESLGDHLEEGRLPWSALRGAGLATVEQLEDAGPARWRAIHGVGARSVERLRAALDRHREARAARPVPPPEGPGDAAAVALIGAARDLLRLRRAVAPLEGRLAQAARRRDADLARLRRPARLARWINPFGDRATEAPSETETAEPELQALAQEVWAVERRLRDALGRPGEPAALERDYHERRADYVALLETVLGREAACGDVAFIPGEILARMEAITLDLTGMQITLRGYQDFGARFLIAQERALIGDEMGLGKTIQALAVMTHLRNGGEHRRFLAVCPSSIVDNWARETAARCDLPVHVLRGAERHAATPRWLATGGLAVVSFDTLRAGDLLTALRDDGGRIAFLVGDEAHYVKNPDAGRTRAFREAAGLADHVCLMTGTPIENRLPEFRALLAALAGERAAAIARGIPEDGAPRIPRDAFMTLVAPVYLRRNQEDVLTELPERIEKDEWIRLTPADRAAYEAAVRARQFMAMRRTATLGAGETDSAKLERLVELVREYREAGRKMLVFSFFLEVLDHVAERVPEARLISGAVPPPRRQELMDAFTAAPGFALLALQIGVAGVGLNLQAASVVVLMEPQWKPSTESQAIARAHRMGQTRAVVVHRLLAEDAVDERMVALLREKQATFDAYVRDSVLKTTDDAATETRLTAELIDAELRRLEPDPPPASA